MKKSGSDKIASEMKIFWIFSILIITIETVSSKPLFYGTPQTLTRIVASASSAASKPLSPISYISDLRPNKIRKQEDDDLANDDFFKESLEELSENSPQSPPATTSDNNEATPSLLQKKINKILNKLRFISMLTAGSGTNNQDEDGEDDDFEKEQEDFNKEFEADFPKNNSTITINNIRKLDKQQQLTPNGGYYYTKPLIKDKENQINNNNNNNEIRTNFGVFFMELIGSLVGLAYGAAAQFNQQQQNGVATTPTPSFQFN